MIKKKVKKKVDKQTRQAESRLVQVAHRLVGLFGGRRLGRGGGGHGLRCDGHLADRPVVQPPGYAPELSQLWREKQRETPPFGLPRIASRTPSRKHSQSQTVPCCELLSSCKRSRGRAFGVRSGPSPRRRGGFLPPRRSCPG